MPANYRSAWRDDHRAQQVGEGSNLCGFAADAPIQTESCLMSEPGKATVILMAEDDADDRLLVQDALAECPWKGELRFVENGEELLDYLMHRGKYAGRNNAPRPALILL